MTPTRTFDLLERALNLFPGNQALAEKVEGEWIFYSSEQYNEIAHQFAYGLLEMGYKKGDKIVTVTNNRPQWNFVDMGMSLAGVVHVPVYTSMNEEEYSYILDHSDAKMVIVADKKLHDLLSPIVKEKNAVDHYYTFDEIKGATSWLEVIEKGKAAGEEIQSRLEDLKHSILPDDFHLYPIEH